MSLRARWIVCLRCIFLFWYTAIVSYVRKETGAQVSFFPGKSMFGAISNRTSNLSSMFRGLSNKSQSLSHISNNPSLQSVVQNEICAIPLPSPAQQKTAVPCGAFLFIKVFVHGSIPI